MKLDDDDRELGRLEIRILAVFLALPFVLVFALMLAATAVEISGWW